jgi:ribosome-associated toxin RatA of RatAB toxin-antitoxin module
MPNVSKNIIVPYSVSQMFALVNNVADYQNFLPWCKASDIISQSPTEISASLTLAKGGIQKTFATRNSIQQNKMIEVRLLDGPFKHLEGFWQFEPISENSCRITFNLEFEFSNKLLSLAFGSIFQQVTQNLVDAFTDRAKQVYE